MRLRGYTFKVTLAGITFINTLQTGNICFCMYLLTAKTGLILIIWLVVGYEIVCEKYSFKHIHLTRNCEPDARKNFEDFNVQ